MKTWIKLAGTGVTALAALCCAAAAIGGITGGAGSGVEAGELVYPGCDEDAEFILREYDGCVAVFAAGGHTPLSTTDIQVRTLRAADRQLLHSGLPCEDRDEVLTLLEDLGS